MYVQLQVSVPNKEVGDRLKDVLLQNRLAACIQILGPIESHYWWEGEIAVSQEYLCLIKIQELQYQEVEQLILEIHPYEIPEIIAIPISQGLRTYLQWIDEAVRG